ncbi:MAG TPA: hypothetical protein VN083_04450 [Vicinamibacteria bacterium]|nr:hypothetical protein [Vicinamibacteria bacterium]
MSERGLVLSVILALAVGSLACGHSESQIVDQYFQAATAKDSQTVGSFALVGFDQKAEKWTIDKVEPEAKSPARLPELTKKLQDAEAAVAANTKAARGYSIEHVNEVDQIREIQKKRGKIPASLSAPAAEWEKFTQKDRDFKRAAAEAREALQKEKDAVALSLIERNDDLTGLTGDELDKKVDLVVTIAGQPKNYAMTLRKYELHEEGKTNNRMSRWIVAALEPRS